MQSDNSLALQVIEWLQQVPYADADNPCPSSRPEKKIDYETWFRSGRQIKGSEAALLKLLRTHDSRVDLAQVAYALGWVGGSPSVPVLIEALGSDNSRVRVEAAASLGRLGDSRAVEPLCKRLSHDSDNNVRANACVALGMIGDYRAESYLHSALSDKSEFVAKLAKEALDRIAKKPKKTQPRITTGERRGQS